MSSEPSGQRWYVAQSQPGREDVAIENLERQGFSTFCPRHIRRRKIGRVTRSVNAPFFPGYVFVKLDLNRDSWRSVNGTYGVSKLVAFDQSTLGQPSALPIGLVEELQNRVGEDGAFDLSATLKPGDTVRVVGGPFEDLLGRLEHVRDHERVTVLLGLLSREVRVTLPRTQLMQAAV